MHVFTINSWCIATPISGLLSSKRHAAPIMLYLCVSHTEALLMASNTSYHKRLHGSHRFACHILTLFTAYRCLTVLAHDLEHEDNILLYFM
jgi:hypothetical protein